jgi:hypothetical protein
VTAVPDVRPVPHPVQHPVQHRRTAVARRPSQLARAVEGALARLDGPSTALGHATRTAVDRHLRAALSRHVARAGEAAPGVAAVRVACAHLAAGDLELSYLALLTARDQLG